ncbi:MAG TPA: hypothetical protein VK348_07705, partial [Planctomycetota bacterium]|nr:hypothetical protein [Planctomycetota bacterium]
MFREVCRAACILFWSPAVLLLAQESTVTWKGEPKTLEALRAEAPAVAETVGNWLHFADALHYRLVLSDDRRVLLGLSDTFARKPRKEHHEVEVMLELMRDTAMVTDRIIAPAGKEQPPFVIFSVRTADYPKLVAHVGELDSKLQEWAGQAGLLVTGFILSEPLVGAWIEDPAGVDEWHPYNELVHRTAELLIRARAPQLPAWLMLGLGWHVEDTVRSCVYCFPHRSSFVAATDHTDWGLWLANNFKKERREKAKKPAVLGVDEFVAWKPKVERDEFEGKAYIAFGVARYLAQEHTVQLQALAEKFNAATLKGSRIMTSETEWRTDPDYQMPAADQLALLQEV